MAGLESEQHLATPRVNDRLADMESRLLALQPALGVLMDKAVQLFEDIYPQAPLLMEVSEHPIVLYKTRSLDTCPIELVPTLRELTIVLDAGRWVRIFRNSESTPDSYPRQILWFRRPEGVSERQIDVMRTHSPRRIEIPFDIETSDFNVIDKHVSTVGGGGYAGQEPSIEETNLALDEARVVARAYGVLVPVL